MKEKSCEKEFPMEWSAEEEIQLFFALEGLKPVGVNKYFYMACISDRLSKSLKRDIPTDVIWAHLKTMYNLDVLDDLEPLPFPNEEKEFSLPDEYSALLIKKRVENEEKHFDDNANKGKDSDKKISTKVVEGPPKRGLKRTRGNITLDLLASPSVSSPTPQSSKRRRI